jgi:hypothetical protein
MAEEYQGLLANERLRVAEEAANRTRGRGGVFLAAKGAERMRQGTRSMLGIEEPVVAEAKAKAAKDAKLQSILSKYPNMQTRADYQKAINELYINGYTEHANSILNLMKELPQAKDEKTDKIRNYEYGQALPEGERQAYFDSINPSQVPNSYAEYQRTDATPTGAEYLAYLNNAGNNVEQTTEWRNYSNTTMNPTKEGFAIWIDRNQNIQKFGSAKELRLSMLANDPKFIALPEAEQKIKLDAIESEYADIETFTQNGVVYDAVTREAMLPGSKEKIPTITVGGRIYDARDMTLLNSDGVKRKMVKREDDKWYYEDNGSRVFNNDVTVKNPEEKAAQIYQEFGMPQNEKQKVELATKLIKDGLAGTDVFSDLMKSVDKDSANAIQSESLIVKSIERLSENYVDSGVGTMNDILIPVEKLIGQYMTAAEAPDGTIVFEGSIPGWSTIKRGQRIFPGEVGEQARYFADTATSLINKVLKDRSGLAVTDAEWQRLQNEYSSGLTTSAQFASWVKRIRDYTNKTEQNVIGGYEPIVVNRYFANQGQYVTLTDPDDPQQRNQIPIGGFYKDGKGNIRKRSQE